MIFNFIQKIEHFLFGIKVTTEDKIDILVKRKSLVNKICEGVHLCYEPLLPSSITSEFSEYEKVGDFILDKNTNQSFSIPKVVLNRPPLFRLNGDIDRTFSAFIKDNPVTVIVSKKYSNFRERKFVFLDGEPVTRSGNVNGLSKKKIIQKVGDLFIGTFSGKKDCVTNWIVINREPDETTLSFTTFVNKGYLVLDMSIIPSKESVIVTCEDSILNLQEKIKRSYVLARSILLAISATNIKISETVEDELALKILSAI